MTYLILATSPACDASIQTKVNSDPRINIASKCVRLSYKPRLRNSHYPRTHRFSQRYNQSPRTRKEKSHIPLAPHLIVDHIPQFQNHQDHERLLLNNKEAFKVAPRGWSGVTQPDCSYCLTSRQPVLPTIWLHLIPLHRYGRGVGRFNTATDCRVPWMPR